MDKLIGYSSVYIQYAVCVWCLVAIAGTYLVPIVDVYIRARISWCLVPMVDVYSRVWPCAGPW